MAFLKRHLIIVLAMALMISAVVSEANPAAKHGGLTEAAAKAGFLYNCAVFVSWPSSAQKGAEVVIGVVGDDPVTRVLADVQGRTVNGRVLRIKRLQTTDDLAGVHIVFIATDDPRTAATFITGIGSAPVLTVGEHDEFTRLGGIVRLYTDQDRLRFEINVTRVESAGLKVSAKMLGLAKIVR